METRLVNDIRNYLQTQVEHPSWDETEKLDVGCEIEHKGWKQHKAMKFYYKPFTVLIGNDTYQVTALRSYNTIVGFLYKGIVYEVGKYSSSTSRQIRDFAKGTELISFERIRG